MDFAHFKNNCRIIAADLSKQKALDADSRAIQPIILTGRANAGTMIYYILEQSKETVLQFSKGTTKVLLIEYSYVTVKLSHRQLKNLKTAVKNNIGTTLTMSLNIFNGKDLPHDLLLTVRQKIKLRNALNNKLSSDIKLSKAQISKIIQSGGILESLLSKLASRLMKVAAPLAKNILSPLGITAAASAIDAGISKKIHGSGTATLIISGEEMNDIMKFVQALEDCNILLNRITKTIKNETQEQKGGFLSMLLGTLGVRKFIKRK